MGSLRTRIAALYAALIVLVIAVGAVSIDFAFRSLLIDQAKLNLAETANQIAHAAQEEMTFGFGTGRVALVLSDRATLDHWASANEFVQIDTVAGQVLGKSTNLGGFTFPPWPALPHGWEPLPTPTPRS